MRLTERDREILRCFHRHRFLRSTHLTSLLPGSRQQVLRRLQLLYHHGYLERPRRQIDYYLSGSRCMVYGLGNKGARLSERKGSRSFHPFDWRRKNQVTRFFMEHALMISDLMVAVELACRTRPEVKLIVPDKPLHWKVVLNRTVKTGVVPDAAFALEWNGRRCWYFLEADRGTMPLTRRGLDQTSVQRKLLAYAATWSQKILHRDFGIHRFRVLTVTANSSRVREMIRLCHELKHGKGIFLCVDLATLLAEQDFFALRWDSTAELPACLAKEFSDRAVF